MNSTTSLPFSSLSMNCSIDIAVILPDARGLSQPRDSHPFEVPNICSANVSRKTVQSPCRDFMPGWSNLAGQTLPAKPCQPNLASQTLPAKPCQPNLASNAMPPAHRHG